MVKLFQTLGSNVLYLLNLMTVHLTHQRSFLNRTKNIFYRLSVLNYNCLYSGIQNITFRINDNSNEYLS